MAISKTILTPEEEEINKKIDAQLMKNPNNMPPAVYYIVPNEFAERFCFYGINPLLNSFFRDYLNQGKAQAMKLKHSYTFLAYLTPLFGAAISDTYLGKYHTIVYLSYVYIFGIGVTSFFSAPTIFGNPPSLIGPMIGLMLVAIGTGGIKPCVSAHGGDQFLDIQKTQLNSFYNYFYMSINLGSILGGLVTSIVVKQKCFYAENDCYSPAIALCAGVMLISLALFVLGKKSYRIVPASNIFMPGIALDVVIRSSFRWLIKGERPADKNGSFIDLAKENYPIEIIDEVRDLLIMLLVLLPAPIFWMAFDQTGTTWQNQYTLMDQTWFGIIPVDEVQSNLINPIMIILMVPVFTMFVYPVTERVFKLKLLDRMVVGMLLAAVSFGITAAFQQMIDANPDALILKEGALVCDQNHREKCMSGGRIPSLINLAWHLLPYWVLTCAEIMFSISGLNFTYEEVGPRTKASAASLWLLMVAFGNLLDVPFSEFYEKWGAYWFMIANVVIMLITTVVYFTLRFFYTYRADRCLPPSEGSQIVTDEIIQPPAKIKSIEDSKPYE